MNPFPGVPCPLRPRLPASPCLALLGLLSALAAHSATSVADLRSRLSSHLEQPRFAAATWGIKIVSLDTGATWFESNAHKLFRPASNAKLFTAAAALDRLGPDRRIRTSLSASASPTRSGTLRADLIVTGGGDPMFSVRHRRGDALQALQPLVAALRAAGVRRIHGDLVGDDQRFTGPRVGSGWTWEDLQRPFGAEVSALSLAGNVVEVILSPGAAVGSPARIQTRPATRYLELVNRTTTPDADGAPWIELYRPPGANVVFVTGEMPLGGASVSDEVTVHDPALWFVTQLREQLALNGIRVTGRARVLTTRERQTSHPPRIELASVESPPLGELVRDMMKTSGNLQAQLLLLQVGAWRADREPPTAARTTEQNGLEELGRFLGEVGVPQSEVLLNEGTGLSPNALVTPNAITALLTAMSRHRQAAAWQAGFPVAGVDGTLRDRMRETPAAGKLIAKTGSLRRTRTLSGYVRTADGEQLGFCLMLDNHVAESKEAADRDIDAVAVMLAEWVDRRETK